MKKKNSYCCKYLKGAFKEGIIRSSIEWEYMCDGEGFQRRVTLFEVTACDPKGNEYKQKVWIQYCPFCGIELDNRG